MPIVTLYRNDHCEWIDCQAPTAEDLKYIHERYGINNLLLDDTVDRNHLPKFEENNGVKFFLTRENTESESSALNSISDISTKLGIFVLDNVIITVHRIQNRSITQLKDELMDAKKDITEKNIALKLAAKVLDSYNIQGDKLAEIIDHTENEIFTKAPKERNQIQRLYRLKRKTALNGRILSLSGDWVNNFKKLGVAEAEFTDLQDSYKDVVSDYEHLHGQITSLISMFIALSDQRANQVMKLLAMYSVYFLPISFIAGLYGMNFKYMPELEHKYGYFITLGVMAAIVIVTFIYFRRKKWQ